MKGRSGLYRAAAPEEMLPVLKRRLALANKEKR